MTGTIRTLLRAQGRGTIVGDDGREYVFFAEAVLDMPFHELSVAAIVEFEPAKGEDVWLADRLKMVRR